MDEIKELDGADELPPSNELVEGEAIVEDNELSQYQAAPIDEVETIEHDKLLSIIESILFASDRPTSVEMIKSVFKGTNIRTKDIRKALEDLSERYTMGERGVMLEDVGGGYQLRTKLDNTEFMRRHVKGRAFRLSGPALEVLSIVAYKQPIIKSEVDEIRGVESGHLMRALMDRGLIRFAGKSELPGKPMLYETTRKFLEIFGLRNIKELPSLSEIDELIPEGIGEIEDEKKTLQDLTPELSMTSSSATYSEGEEELLKISDQLSDINTSTEFFEQEKARQKRKRDEERAQDIREAMVLGQEVTESDKRWLRKFEETLVLDARVEAPAEPPTETQAEAAIEADATDAKVEV